MFKGQKEEKRWSPRKKQESCWFSLKGDFWRRYRSTGGIRVHLSNPGQSRYRLTSPVSNSIQVTVPAGGGGESRCIHHASPPPDPRGWRVPTFREHRLLMSATSEGLADGSPARRGGSRLGRAAPGSEPSALGSTPFPILTFTQKGGN